MRAAAAALIVLSAPALRAQAWELRWEVPFPQGQSLPQTLVAGTGQLLSGDLDTGNGAILGLHRRLLVVGPVLRFQAGVEVSRLAAGGQLQQGAAASGTRLVQRGIGVGLDAQFWIPFTGVGGELGLVQRFQDYRFEASGNSAARRLSRTWLRVGARWRLPAVGVRPFLAASYQEPLRKDRPVQVGSVSDLAGYLAVQGSGQEFSRMWTFGVGIGF